MSVVLLDTTVASMLHPKKRGTEILDRYAVHMEKKDAGPQLSECSGALELGRSQGLG